MRRRRRARRATMWMRCCVDDARTRRRGARDDAGDWGRIEIESSRRALLRERLHTRKGGDGGGG